MWSHALARRGIASVAVAVLLVACGGSPQRLRVHSARIHGTPATPETFARVFERARGGETIVLAAGDYGTFHGAVKPSLVTIAAPGGVKATMTVDFNPASNLHLEGLTIEGLTYRGATHDVSVSRSLFTGMAVVHSDEMSHANVVFDGNAHPRVDKCGDCFEGRLEIVGGKKPAGVTIKNSTFGPGGDADGVQVAAGGVSVIDNEFTGIKWSDRVHTDSLQLYGSDNTVVRGNYFHDFSVAIMAPDGGENEQITDNVFLGSPDYMPSIQLGGHHDTLFAHNVTRDIDVYVDAKKGERPGAGNVVRDNVVIGGALVVPPERCSGCDVSHNLFSRADTSGDSPVVADPVFAGGTEPRTGRGWMLAPGSPGSGTATDGGNPGVRRATGPSRA